jgi:hypothetical protein
MEVGGLCGKCHRTLVKHAGASSRALSKGRSMNYAKTVLVTSSQAVLRVSADIQMSKIFDNPGLKRDSAYSFEKMAPLLVWSV